MEVKIINPKLCIMKKYLVIIKTDKSSVRVFDLSIEKDDLVLGNDNTQLEFIINANSFSSAIESAFDKLGNIELGTMMEEVWRNSAPH
jgi:hypothetical protein